MTQPGTEGIFGTPKSLRSFICTVPWQSIKALIPTSNQAAHLRVLVLSQSPYSVTHTQPGHGQNTKQRTDRKSPRNPAFQTPSPQLSTHSPKMTGPVRGTWGQLGMPAGSQLMANGLSTHAHGRSGGEKATAPTGCLCRAGETQKDSLVPEFLPHRRCKSFWVPTASAGVSSSSEAHTPFSFIYSRIVSIECWVHVDKPSPAPQMNIY